jgi:hypothetical protein
VPIWIDDRARLAHAKTMVVDGTVTLIGSSNWTRRASAAATRRVCPVRSPPGLVPGFIGGGPVMGKRSPGYQSLQARGFRRGEGAGSESEASVPQVRSSRSSGGHEAADCENRSSYSPKSARSNRIGLTTQMQRH